MSLFGVLLLGRAHAIDFTPTVAADDSPRMRRTPRLLFNDGNKTAYYICPAGWSYAGNSERLTLLANDRSHSTGTIYEVPLEKSQRLDEETVTTLTQEVLDNLPEDSSKIRVVRVEKNPLMVDGNETVEIILSYHASRLARYRSVLVVNRPKSQLRFVLDGLDIDFDAAHEIFRRSYWSFQWVVAAPPTLPAAK